MFSCFHFLHLFSSACLLFVVVVVKSLPDESFHEELLLKRLPSLHTLANFRFQSVKSSELGDHYNLFPKLIGELIQHYELDELHLSLTQGFWRQNSWGYQPRPASPVGAQVWVWFKHNTTEINEKWKNLVHALSGLFCASLSQLEPTLTLTPEFSFRPAGVLEDAPPDNDRLRYGVLPSENVCTENLTPWKKMLPCNERGLSSLLNPLHLYESHFHSMSVDARRICQKDKDCVRPQWEVTQSIISVFDAPVIRKTLNWSLKDFFGTPIRRLCALAESSNVFVDYSLDSAPKFHPEQTELVIDESKNLKIARFDLKKLFTGGNLDVGATYSDPVSFQKIPVCPVSLHSYVGGNGLHRGILISRLENVQKKGQKLVFMQIVPWFLRTFFHTMKLTCTDLVGKKETLLKPLFMEIQPGKDRLRPYFLELGLELPPGSRCLVEIEFERSLLRWTEYPPDAHRGFFIPAAVVSLESEGWANKTLPNGRSTMFGESLRHPVAPWIIQLFGEVRLVNLPTPDFSMPYNVICLVCTVVALAFGPIHNMTTKSLVFKDPEEVKKSGLKLKVRNIVKKIFDKFRKRKTEEKSDSASHEKNERVILDK